MQNCNVFLKQHDLLHKLLIAVHIKELVPEQLVLRVCVMVDEGEIPLVLAFTKQLSSTFNGADCYYLHSVWPSTEMLTSYFTLFSSQ